MEWIKLFCGWIYHFSISLTLVVLQRQKAYRIVAVLLFKMSAAISLSCNIFLAFNSLRPRRDRRHFADDIFKCIFWSENEWILLRISPKFVPKVRINIIPSLVQIMAWRRPGDKPLSEPMVVRLPTHICVIRPQWVKWILMMTSGQNISHYATAKLSVHVWNHDLIWWQNRIDTQKHFHKTTITSSWTLSKTKIPITIFSKGANVVKPESEVPHAGQ